MTTPLFHTLPLAFLNMGPWEIALIVIVILLMFGGKKIPELAKGVAKGLKGFRREMDDVKGQIKDSLDADEKNQSESSDPKPRKRNEDD